MASPDDGPTAQKSENVIRKATKQVGMMGFLKPLAAEALIAHKRRDPTMFNSNTAAKQVADLEASKMAAAKKICQGALGGLCLTTQEAPISHVVACPSDALAGGHRQRRTPASCESLEATPSCPVRWAWRVLCARLVPAWPLRSSTQKQGRSWTGALARDG